MYIYHNALTNLSRHRLTVRCTDSTAIKPASLGLGNAKKDTRHSEPLPTYCKKLSHHLPRSCPSSVAGLDDDTLQYKKIAQWNPIIPYPWSSVYLFATQSSHGIEESCCKIGAKSTKIMHFLFEVILNIIAIHHAAYLGGHIFIVIGELISWVSWSQSHVSLGAMIWPRLTRPHWDSHCSWNHFK